MTVDESDDRRPTMRTWAAAGVLAAAALFCAADLYLPTLLVERVRRHYYLIALKDGLFIYIRRPEARGDRTLAAPPGLGPGLQACMAEGVNPPLPPTS